MDVHPPAPSAADLLARARRGDLNALAAFIELHRRELLRAVKAVGHRELLARMEAEDVFQEAMLQALHSVRHLRALDLASFRAWFRSIARHRLFRFHKRELVRDRPRRSTPLPAALLAYLDPVSLEHAEAREESSELSAENAPRFLGLHTDQRLAFVLRQILEADWETIAFVLNRSTNDAARLLTRRAQLELERRSISA